MSHTNRLLFTSTYTPTLGRFFFNSNTSKEIACSKTSSVNFARWIQRLNIYMYIHCIYIYMLRHIYCNITQTHAQSDSNKPHEWLLNRDITVLHTQRAEIESPIYRSAVGPALLMRSDLIEHPACYLCLHQAVSRFTLHKYYITTGPIH